MVPTVASTTKLARKDVAELNARVRNAFAPPKRESATSRWIEIVILKRTPSYFIRRPKGAVP